MTGPAEAVAQPEVQVARGRMAVAAALAVLSVLFIVGGLGLGLGDRTTLGPGLFPIIAGILGLVAAVLALVEAVVRKGDAVLSTTLPTRQGAMRMLLFVFGLCAFAALLERAGFVIAAAVACAAASRASGQKHLWRAVGSAVAFAVVIYVTFTELLAVSLPGFPVGS